MSKLYPVKRMFGCRGYGTSRCQVYKSKNITAKFTSFTTKKRRWNNYKSDVRKAESGTWKMQKKSFCKVIFYIKVFLKT